MVGNETRNRSRERSEGLIRMAKEWIIYHRSNEEPSKGLMGVA